MQIDFNGIAAAALVNSRFVAEWLLPGGRVVGNEYQALNPRRQDRNIGSFSVNLTTGRWSDFAMIGVAGRDLIGLASYIWCCGQGEAAKKIAEHLGISVK